MLTSVFCVDKKSFQEIVESFLACSDWPVHTNNHDICDDCWSITVSSVSSIDYIYYCTKQNLVISITLLYPSVCHEHSALFLHIGKTCVVLQKLEFSCGACALNHLIYVSGLWEVRGGAKLQAFHILFFKLAFDEFWEKNYILFFYVYETLPPMFSFGTSMWLGAYKSKSQCNVVRLIRAKGNDKGTWFLICRFKKMFVQKHKEPND